MQQLLKSVGKILKLNSLAMLGVDVFNLQVVYTYWVGVRLLQHNRDQCEIIPWAHCLTSSQFYSAVVNDTSIHVHNK